MHVCVCMGVQRRQNSMGQVWINQLPGFSDFSPLLDA